MKISIITLFPDMIAGFFKESIVKRAQEKNLVDIKLVNLRNFAVDEYGSVDDRPYGGGAGMVMKVEPLYKAIQSVKCKVQSSKLRIVLTSAKGKRFKQEKATEYSKLDHLVIIAGHYEGVDERVLKYVDEEISLGDFVMTGGEIVASAIVDSVVRLIPGVLKKEDATTNESFFTVSINRLIETIGEDELLEKLKEKKIETIQLLEYPHYTRPPEFMGDKVPEVLLSGDPKKIEAWKLKQAYEETLKKRPDLLKIT